MNPELIDFTRRLWNAATFCLPLLVVAVGPEMFNWLVIAARWSAWLQLALAAPVVRWCGAPFYAREWTSLATHQLNMSTLVTTGVGAAFLYSLVATLLPASVPLAGGMHGAAPVYYEAAGVVVALVLLGQVLVLRARAATGRDIRALLDLTPKTAWRIASAGITLTGGDIVAIVRARRLSTATLRNIRQNLFFSFVFNGIGVPVAAGVIYPVFGILLSPMFAGGAMALSSLSVGVNALRLGTVKL